MSKREGTAGTRFPKRLACANSAIVRAHILPAWDSSIHLDSSRPFMANVTGPPSVQGRRSIVKNGAANVRAASSVGFRVGLTWGGITFCLSLLLVTSCLR